MNERNGDDEEIAVNEDLLAKYHNKDNDYAFGSKKTVYRYFPHLKRKVVDKTLLKSRVFTKFKKYKRPRQYLPVYGESCFFLSFLQ